MALKADALRRQREAVFGHRVTFRGEHREPSVSRIVVGMVEVKRRAWSRARSKAAGSRRRRASTSHIFGPFEGVRFWVVPSRP
jgi:hypothetical protein